MRSQKKKTCLHVKLFALIPVVPLLLVFIYYRMPNEYKPYVISMNGEWKVHEGDDPAWKDRDFDDSSWKPFKIPGKYFRKGFKDSKCYLRKSFVLKDTMTNQDLFFMTSRLMVNYARVYINGVYADNLGNEQGKKSIESFNNLQGTEINKGLVKPGTNLIALEIEWKFFNRNNSGYDGADDPRFYVGTKKYLEMYFKNNDFVINFFQFGNVFFCLFVLALMIVLAVSERHSEDLYKYMSTAFLVFSALIYCIFSSGAFVTFVVPDFWRVVGIAGAIVFMGFSIFEFFEYYFLSRITLLGKINRVVCGLTVSLYVVFPNTPFMGRVFSVFSIYFFVAVLYVTFIALRDSLVRKEKEYGLIITSVVIFGGLSGLSGILANLGILESTPRTFPITITNMAIAATLVVVMDFIRISSTNKQLTVSLRELNVHLEDKVKERTTELQQARDELWGEMELAKKIQTVLLPKKPEIPGYEIAATMLTASEVGGDYYDIINVKDVNWAVIGDVSGHGVPAGLVMMMAQTAIHTVLEENPKVLPSMLLTVINKVIASNIKQLGEDKYMTITVFAVDEDGKLKFSGMHQPLVIYRHAKKVIERTDTRGMWIGMWEDIAGMVKDDEVKLEKGDVLLLYTDGITEAWEKGTLKNKRGQSNMFGDKNLDAALLKNAEKTSEEIKNGVLQALEGYDFSDDVTMMVLKRG